MVNKSKDGWAHRRLNILGHLVRTGVAKIVTNPNMTGVLTNEQINELKEGLPNSASASQIKRIAARAKADFANRHESIDEQIIKIKKSFGDLTSRSAPASSETNNPKKPVPWTEFIK